MLFLSVSCALWELPLIQPSTSISSRQDFLTRVKENEKLKAEAKKAKQPAPECKRYAKEPIGAHTVSAKNNEPQFLAPIPYEFIA